MAWVRDGDPQHDAIWLEGFKAGVREAHHAFASELTRAKNGADATCDRRVRDFEQVYGQEAPDG